MGASHTAHPDTHKYGLHDKCPRCKQHARHPLDSLDTENLRRLWIDGPQSPLDEEAYGEMKQEYQRAKAVMAVFASIEGGTA